MPRGEKKILSVGLVCLDVVNVVRSYPLEDTDQRSVDQYHFRGGNANNTCAVLVELGQTCEFFGTLADGALETSLMERAFRDDGIDISKCVRFKEVLCPNSCVIVNAENASRTIIHTNKNLPELSAVDFEAKILPHLCDYDWIHFEGRNKDEVKLMIDSVRSASKDIVISVEVEKVGRGFEELIPFGDVVFVSKDVAKEHGAKDKEAAIRIFRDQLRPKAKLVVAWGEFGASAFDKAESASYLSPAFPPPNGIVDTLGAGDSFNAGVILALRRRNKLSDALNFGCQIAGAKVGQRGFRGLGDKFNA